MNVDLNGCINGDKRAWDAFVQQTAGLIYAAVRRTMRRFTAEAQDIEDRVQDVYVKLLQDNARLLRQFDPTRASLSTYLTLVARSTTRDSLQKRRLETVPLIDRDGAAMQSPHVSQSSDTSPACNGALPPMESLTERQREVIAMLFEQGMTVEQAAARLGVDAQTIRSTKHKALTRLRDAAGQIASSKQKAENTANPSGESETSGDTPRSDRL